MIAGSLASTRGCSLPCVLVVSSGVPTVWIVELLPVVEPLPVVELPNIISIKLTLFDKGEPGPLAPGLATDVSAAVVPTLLDADPDCAARGAWRAASCAHCTFCSIIELITCRSPLLMIGWGEACTIRAISRALKDNGSADRRRHLMPARWDDRHKLPSQHRMPHRGNADISGALCRLAVSARTRAGRRKGGSVACLRPCR